MAQTYGTIVRLSVDHLPERDRVAQWREVFGRQVFRLDVETPPDSHFVGDVTLRVLPGLSMLSGTVGRGVRTGRVRELLCDGIDDLLFTINLAGRMSASQRGIEAQLSPREAVLLSLDEVCATTRQLDGHGLGLRIPRAALAPLVTGLDDMMMRPIPQDAAALQLLTSYVGLLRTHQILNEPQAQRSIVGHIHDLVALTIGASRDAREIAAGRGVRAARLHAIKNDISQSLTRANLSLDEIGRRHGISPRYIRMLFAGEGTNFSEYVLHQRLTKAHRMLSDPRFVEHKVSAIAFECGFGDLSYFYQAFRRRYGGTPSDIRAQAARDGE
jgi:AraC-like DNA-binding protein